ncbi:hypothetical protein Bealeia1_01644 [Candidatus Bealeia paramacronuclearis]|uniref:Cyanovirin-N domain-containing protein n=1 Tax=Candidatus Bealeia paramacronuclearis TaxID=1921001 RepID=A0ABZ2C7B8_9PROT|nr:hypothetical protein [Candidatus Bealeia paramacronuclearis]
MHTFARFLTLGSLVFGAVALQATNPNPVPINNKSFLITCKNCNIRSDSFLNCECKRKNQQNADSSLNLSNFHTPAGSVSDLWKALSLQVQNCDGILTITESCPHN